MIKAIIISIMNYDHKKKDINNSFQLFSHYSRVKTKENHSYLSRNF